jgi:putative nucleotidyltransferase with HDIG domain
MISQPETKTFRFSEVLSALSLALDRVEGQPEGHAVRSCFIGMTIAGRLGLGQDARSALFYALLLKDAGCSSNASRMSALFDADDLETKRTVKMVDWTSLPHAALYAARTVSPQGPPWRKAGRLLNFGLQGQGASRRLIQIRCERGAEITRLMGFPEETARAIRSLDEHWDGAGHPDGLKGEEIPLLARVCGLAQTVEVFYKAHGPAAAEEVARVRSGRWFDPELVDAFLAAARAGGLWESLARADLRHEVSRLEPADRVLVATPERLDLTSRAFAEIIDAKSPFTYRHSEGVSEVAVAMGERLGFDADARRDLMRAGLLHDIGKLGVSNRILDKPGRLTDAEFARIREHPKLTHDILSRITPFRRIAETAANHHEKLDGSGYHRGLRGKDLDLPSRILAVADVYDALTQERPYRQALPKEKALGILAGESGARLCPRSVAALEELAAEDAV